MICPNCREEYKAAHYSQCPVCCTKTPTPLPREASETPVIQHWFGTIADRKGWWVRQCGVTSWQPCANSDDAPVLSPSVGHLQAELAAVTQERDGVLASLHKERNYGLEKLDEKRVLEQENARLKAQLEEAKKEIQRTKDNAWKELTRVRRDAANERADLAAERAKVAELQAELNETSAGEEE